jgi:hypothetical protein
MMLITQDTPPVSFADIPLREGDKNVFPDGTGMIG